MKSPTLQILRQTKKIVVAKSDELAGESQRIVYKALAVKQFERTEEELEKALIPFFVMQGRSMVTKLNGMKSLDEIMEKHEDHDQSTHGRRGGRDSKYPPGECYINAAKAIIEGDKKIKGWKDVKLVHGYPTGTGGDAEGKKYGHSWVEGLDKDFYTVYDPSVGVVVPREVYYVVGNINESEVSRYTPSQMTENLMEHGTWGPWKKPPSGAVFKSFCKKITRTEAERFKHASHDQSTHGRRGGGGGSRSSDPKRVFQGTPVNPNGKDTEEMFRNPDGSWTEERQVLHRQIMDDIKAGKEPVEDPTSYLMGGGTASGKSTLIKGGNVVIPENTVVIDSDDVKERLPEYKAMTEAGDASAAGFTHEESSCISKQLAGEVSRESYNVMLDGTGDSSVESLENKIGLLKGRGQKVEAVYASVPVEVALDRERARVEKTGRKVPETFTRKNHASISRVVPAAIEKGLYDKLEVYDTSTRQGKLLASAEGTNLTVHDQSGWDSFLAKGT